MQIRLPISIRSSIFHRLYFWTWFENLHVLVYSAYFVHDMLLFFVYILYFCKAQWSYFELCYKITVFIIIIIIIIVIIIVIIIIIITADSKITSTADDSKITLAIYCW